MCGILGIFDRGNTRHYDVEAMGRIQQHRGPDHTGTYVDDNVILVHNRLSILDLSNNANQPFESTDGRYLIIYNGEVYNFQEIAATIKTHKPNLQLRTSSDTEIILEAFLMWGTDCVQKLNGMFAFAIYDKETQELYLFRDRLGIKPLFYSYSDDVFCFSSELKGITQSIKKPLSLNTDAVSLFLNFGYVPSPLCIYNEVFKLGAGEFLVFADGKIKKSKYWHIASQIEKDAITNENEAVEKLTDLIQSSIKYQLISDVPLGVFLSGGIDSSLISAMACKNAGIKLNTFTIGFEENKYDESKYARSIADYLGASHNQYILSYRNAIDFIDVFLNSYDEPYADSSGIPTLMVSKLAREHVTVTLSGEGGDELFYGYGSYTWASRLNNPLLRNMRGMAAWGLNLQGSERFKKAARYFNFSKEDYLPFHIFSTEQNLFNQHESQVLTGQKTNALLMLESLKFMDQTERRLNSLEKQSLFDMMYYLQGDLLTKMDRASMRYSLEARVPLLDHRLVEASVNISPGLKVKGGEKKHLLKKILFQQIPRSYFNRPKQGFSIPLQSWIKTELREKIHDKLNQNTLTEIGFSRTIIDQLLKDFYSGQQHMNYNRIWLLYVLTHWLEKHRARIRS